MQRIILKKVPKSSATEYHSMDNDMQSVASDDSWATQEDLPVVENEHNPFLEEIEHQLALLAWITGDGPYPFRRRANTER